MRELQHGDGGQASSVSRSLLLSYTLAHAIPPHPSFPLSADILWNAKQSGQSPHLGFYSRDAKHIFFPGIAPLSLSICSAAPRKSVWTGGEGRGAQPETRTPTRRFGRLERELWLVFIFINCRKPISAALLRLSSLLHCKLSYISKTFFYIYLTQNIWQRTPLLIPDLAVKCEIAGQEDKLRMSDTSSCCL